MDNNIQEQEVKITEAISPTENLKAKADELLALLAAGDGVKYEELVDSLYGYEPQEILQIENMVREGLEEALQPAVEAAEAPVCDSESVSEEESTTPVEE